MAQSDAIDAVYIASPNSLHFPQTKLFLSHKKHVICEKPLASNIEEVEAAIALARENQWYCLKRSKPPACRTSCCCSNRCRKLAKCVKPLSTTASIPRATSATDGENPNTF